jgi:hypothetical protein
VIKLKPIGKDDAKRIINPHLGKIKRAVSSSISNYLTGKQYAAVRHSHSTRSDASIIHDLIIGEIENEFNDVEGVCHQRKNKLFCLVIDDKVILRFKKFNNNLLGSGINTNQLIAFNLQDPVQLEFTNMPPHGLLYVGYRLNDLNTGINDLHITYRYSNKNVWTWNITYVENEDIKPIELTASYTHQTTTRKVTAKTNDRSVGDINEGDN